MALSFPVTPVGSAVINGADVSLSISGAVDGDYVYVSSGIGDNSPQPGEPSNTGFANTWQLIVNTSPGNLETLKIWKMRWTTGDPTTVTIVGPGNASYVTAGTAIVVRGADTTTQEDVTPTTAGSNSNGNPDAPAITPASNDCAILAFYACRINDGTIGNPPTGYLPTSGARANAFDSGPQTVAVVYKILSGGAGSPENPGTFSSWQSGPWAAATIAVRPSASEERDAELDKSLGALVSTATATVEATGELDKMLGALTLTATAAQSFNAQVDATLGALTLDGEGGVVVEGELDESLGALTLSGGGGQEIEAALAATLGALTLSAAAIHIGTAQLLATLDPLTLASEGAVIVEGEASPTLGSLELYAYEGADNAEGALTFGSLGLLATGTSPPLRGFKMKLPLFPPAQLDNPQAWIAFQTQIFDYIRRVTMRANNADFGNTVLRPTFERTMGQPYFDTTIGKPIWWNEDLGEWVDATGAIV